MSSKINSTISYLASQAFANARKEALDAGLSVVESSGDTLYVVFPDGSRIKIKSIEPPTNGTTILIDKADK